MTEFQSVNVNLLDCQPDKLKSTTKNSTGVSLKL